MSSQGLKLAAAEGAAERLPLLRAPLQSAYERHFFKVRGSVRLFCGVFPDFDSARQAIPPGLKVGFDDPESALRFVQDQFRVFPLDYPVMFWLKELLPDCRLLFDWGGNLGISYFAFRRYIRYPADLTWLVSDVPAVVAEGESSARGPGAPGLKFTSSLIELSRADVLLAAGTVQFIERPLDELRAQPALPPHLIFNKVPVYAQPSAVTLQNFGTGLAPNHLFNEAEFVGALTAMGYGLIDAWETGLSCHIPFHPDHSIGTYKGFYFSKRPPARH
jgi:putative methyltransferase (TIGR04325 family)